MNVTKNWEKYLCVCVYVCVCVPMVWEGSKWESTAFDLISVVKGFCRVILRMEKSHLAP